MTFAFKTVENYTESIKTSSGLSNFISQAKISLDNSTYTKALNNYVASLPALSLKTINNIQVADSVSKIIEDATKGVTDITNGLKTSVVQQALSGLSYEASKQLDSIVVQYNTLTSTASVELQTQLLNDAITGISTIKTNALNIANKVITKNALETTKIIEVALTKLQTQLLKDKGYSGTVLISKMTLPEGTMYFKTEDLQKKPELLKTLLESGKITQAQLNSGGIEAKTIMEDYLTYMSKHQSESSILPVLKSETTITQANLGSEIGKSTISDEVAKGNYSTPTFGITPESFSGTAEIEGPFSENEYYWATTTKEGLKVGKVLYDGYEKTGVGAKGTLVKGDILNKLANEEKIDENNWTVVTEGTKLGEHYRLNEISDSGELLAHLVSAQTYGGEAKINSSVAVTLTKTTAEGGVKEIKVAQSVLRSNLSDYEKSGYDVSEIKNVIKTEQAAQITLDKYNESMKAAIALKTGINTGNALSIADGKITVYGQDVSYAVKPESYTMDSWTKMANSVISESPETDVISTTLKSTLSTMLNLYMDRDTKLANAGLGTQEIVNTAYTGDWSLTKVLTFWGRELYSGVGSILYGTEAISPDIALNGVYEFKTTDTGLKLANTWASEWATTGKITNNIGLTVNDAKTFVLQNADTNSLNSILKTQQHDLAVLIYNPVTQSSVIDAYGSDITKQIQNTITLTKSDIESANTDVIIYGIQEILSQNITGTPLDILITLGGGGVIGIEGDIIGKISKVSLSGASTIAKATSEISDFAKFVKDAGITISTTTDKLKISDVVSKSLLESAGVSKTLLVPTTEVGWIAKASDVGITEVLSSGKLIDWEPLSVVQDISKSFEKAVDNPINSKIFVDSLVKTDVAVVKSTLAELISIDPVAISNVIETGIKLSDEATGTVVKAILKDANSLFVDTSLAFAKEISTTAVGDSTVAGKLLFDASEILGRTPVENMVTTALEHGTENYNLITNALEEMKKLDTQGAVSIPTTSVSGATRAISGAELELVNIMPENVADKIVRYSGTSELRKINNVEDIAKLNVDEINYLTTEKGITKSDLEKYITKAKEILNPTEAVTKIEDYTKTTDLYKRWNTVEEQKMKEFGITQTETSKLNDKGEQVIELQYEFDTKTINTLTDKEFTSLMRNNRSLLTQVMEQSDLAEIEKLGISTKRKAEIKAEFWNELTGTIEKMEKAKLVAPSSDINELYEIRTALMNNKEAIELTYAKQLKEEGKATVETLSSVKRAREAVNNVDELIEIKKTQIEKATTPVIEIEQIKEALKPGKATPKEAATNAIAQLKKGNIEDAAKALAESSTHKQTILLAGKNTDTYADTSVTKILRMTNEGAPETLVNQMAKERSQYALETLSKKSNDMKKTAFKISEGMQLNSDELKALWKPENRELAFDAMWHEKNPTSLTDELVRDALTRNNADELAQLKKEMQEELTACINRGECI